MFCPSRLPPARTSAGWRLFFLSLRPALLFTREIGITTYIAWSEKGSALSLIDEMDGELRSTTDKPLLRVGEAADILSVSRWTIYRWVEQGRLRGTKIGKGSLRIVRESINELIDHHENQLVHLP